MMAAEFMRIVQSLGKGKVVLGGGVDFDGRFAGAGEDLGRGCGKREDIGGVCCMPLSVRGDQV
jgi:hypothetical protein